MVQLCRLPARDPTDVLRSTALEGHRYVHERPFNLKYAGHALNQAVNILSDRARDIYKAATHEKLAFLRFWNQKARQAAEAADADRVERTEWLQSLTVLKDKLPDDLQVRILLLAIV